jgi:predicted transposase/invertase (TIGR01784 family)
MKHFIDPKIDCVFKAILGAEDNRHLLIHFLNAILGPDLSSPITSVDILNPASGREFVSDKMNVVDVKARDNAARVFQVEIQLLAHRGLPQRMLYSWADLYAKQIESGDQYHMLQPAYSIWLLDADLNRGGSEPIHRYKWKDESKQPLAEHGGIWLIELKKCHWDQVVTEEQRWLKLFKEGQTLNDANLPVWMQTPEMRKVMTVLQQFSDKEENYHTYASRLDYQRTQRAIEDMAKENFDKWSKAEQELSQTEQKLSTAELALQDALAEIERLKAGQP